MSTKIETIRIDDDTRIDGYGIFSAGRYLVEMPSDYDETTITAEDIVHDAALTIMDGGFIVN
jgi:hypothetical protein